MYCLTGLSSYQGLWGGSGPDSPELATSGENVGFLANLENYWVQFHVLFQFYAQYRPAFLTTKVYARNAVELYLQSQKIKEEIQDIIIKKENGHCSKHF